MQWGAFRVDVSADGRAFALGGSGATWARFELDGLTPAGRITGRRPLLRDMPRHDEGQVHCLRESDEEVRYRSHLSYGARRPFHRT